jgi:hypothetical protein
MLKILNVFPKESVKVATSLRILATKELVDQNDVDGYSIEYLLRN